VLLVLHVLLPAALAFQCPPIVTPPTGFPKSSRTETVMLAVQVEPLNPLFGA
jgi:hypothetical protein